MQISMMLTRISGNAVKTLQRLEQLEQTTMKHIQAECADIEWLHSYACLGPYDYVDIFKAADTETATKVSMIIRTYGHGHAEI